MASASQRLRAHLAGMVDVLERLGERPDDVAGAIELPDLSDDSPYAEAGPARLQVVPAVTDLVRERYWGSWPAIEELAQYPEGASQLFHLGAPLLICSVPISCRGR